MKVMNVKEFAQEIYLLDPSSLREPGSKHQKQILDIQNFFIAIAETGSREVAEELIKIKPITCKGETMYVCQCRYLQHCVKLLENNLKSEG